MPPEHVAFARRRLIVIAAPNGARRGKADHPALPMTAGEIATAAESLADAGVAVLHLHVRDAAGAHTLDVGRYREAIAAVRERVGDRLIIQATSEAVGRYRPDEQIAMVESLRPEAVSLALRELCPDAKSEASAGAFFRSLGPMNVWPQYILYSADDVARFDGLRRKGFFGDERPFCLLVLGRYASDLEGRLDELRAMQEAADLDDFPWAVCCFGRQEHAAALAAAAAGGHVRLGFENNLHLADGRIASDNAALVRQFLDAYSAGDRRPATADDVRKAWQLPTP
ncbi:MAG: 3-keto-5-aminohexanoate cleavage protein [Woeseiaceae bacterium]|nr:3-keto-5-aminohexanoate cleavage protein [Woeseiaceae bacterium]